MQSAAWIVLIASLGLAGCAGAELRAQAATIARLESQVAALESVSEQARALRTRLEEMRASQEELKARLDQAEQRLGVAPFHSETVQMLPMALPLDLVKVSQLDHPDAPAQRVDLRRHLQTKRATIIGFWATWCVPCTSPEELAHLRALQHELRGVGADLVSMAIDDLAKVRADPRANQWIRPIWHLIDGHMEIPPREFIQRVGVNLPLFLVVDTDGRLHGYVNRKLDDQTVEDLMTAVMRLR